MEEERTDAPAAPRRKARYRFEYERTPAINLPLVIGVLAAGALGAAAWVNGRAPVKAPEGPAVAAAQAEAPELNGGPPKALAAYRPVKVETPAPAPRTAKPTPSAEPAPAAPSAPPAVVLAVPGPVDVAPSPPAAASPVPSDGEARLAALAATKAAAVDPCAAIRPLVDRMVCADPEVRALDRRVDAAYRNAMQLTDNRGKVLREHERWLARRGEVGPGRTAVLAYYEARYKELWPVPMRVGPRLPPIFKPEAER